MRYTLQLIGYIWQPGVGICATERRCEKHFTDNDEPDPVQEPEAFLIGEDGDFQDVVDYQIIMGGEAVKPWDDEESELTFIDCMCQEEA